MSGVRSSDIVELGELAKVVSCRLVIGASSVFNRVVPTQAHMGVVNRDLSAPPTRGFAERDTLVLVNPWTHVPEVLGVSAEPKVLDPVVVANAVPVVEFSSPGPVVPEPYEMMNPVHLAVHHRDQVALRFHGPDDCSRVTPSDRHSTHHVAMGVTMK